MSGHELPTGTMVLHQRRDAEGRPVIDRYTVREVQAGVAVLIQPGTRKLAHVGVKTILGSPAWAVQGALW